MQCPGTNVYLAADLGASSGRIMAGLIDGGRIDLQEINRFTNGPEQRDGAYHWNVEGLFASIQAGIQLAGERFGERIQSIGVDTWGVDYGLLGADGELIDQPFAYRDARTAAMEAEAFRRLPRRRIYEITGLQFMFFNTLYQLLSEVVTGRQALQRAERLLFMPDLIGYWLSGEAANEYSIASTSQLLDARTGQWSDEILSAMGIPRKLFGPIVLPGTQLGTLKSQLAAPCGLGDVNVISPGSHDTASAVAAVPAEMGVSSAYLSSGTWSLMGVESAVPIITDTSYAYSFTNEGGVSGTIRVLKNICGLWLIQECRRLWAEQGEDLDFATLVALAAAADPFVAFIDPDDARFATPGDMPQRIREYCEHSGQSVPPDKGTVIRICIESLALRYREVFDHLQVLTGKPIEVLHIVGGGVQNELLNQFTANAINRPVLAGPVEATAIGNILMQLMATGNLATLAQGREMVRHSFPVQPYQPEHVAVWERAYTDFLAVTRA
ncbi:MAG: rhamnulokinase [Verrucomicrobia bacterium]|nr:rhamnulokinase [Verrucomicrobiota bacterium]